MAAQRAEQAHLQRAAAAHGASARDDRRSAVSACPATLLSLCSSQLPGDPNSPSTLTCRNIDKAGGLDAYVFKIAGSREDSDKAAQVRAMLEAERQRRENHARQQASRERRQNKEAARAARLKLMPQAARVAFEPEQTASQ